MTRDLGWIMAVALDRLENDIRSEAGAGRVKIANTLQEAAEWMDVDGSAFKKTIDELYYIIRIHGRTDRR